MFTTNLLLSDYQQMDITFVYNNTLSHLSY